MGSDDASFMSSERFSIIIWFSITHSPRMSLSLSLIFGRNATRARCEGVAAAVLSPVRIVRDPIDEVRRHSTEHGWTFINIFTQVPQEHSYDGVATIPSFLDNHRRALVQISGEQLVWDIDMVALTRCPPLPSDFCLLNGDILENQAPMFPSKLQRNFDILSNYK